jgi:hypothetical protein
MRLQQVERWLYTYLPHTPHAIEFDCYVSHDKDDGMPSTTPAAIIVVVAVPILV